MFMWSVCLTLAEVVMHFLTFLSVEPKKLTELIEFPGTLTVEPYFNTCYEEVRLSLPPSIDLIYGKVLIAVFLNDRYGTCCGLSGFQACFLRVFYSF